MNRIKPLKTVKFNKSNIEIFNYNGQQYIAGADIERALGYKSQGKVSKIYNKYKDEFDSDMSISLKPKSDLRKNNNLKYTIRYYNRRGAYLIAMLSKTKIAKDFRKWVLDILENSQKPSIPIQQQKTVMPADKNPKSVLWEELNINPDNPFASDIISSIKHAKIFLSEHAYKLIINNLTALISNPNSFNSKTVLTEIYHAIESSKTQSNIINYEQFELTIASKKKWEDDLMAAYNRILLEKSGKLGA